MRQFLLLWLMLMGAWILLSQELSAQALVLGAVLCVAAAAFSFSVFYDREDRRQSRIVFRWDLLLVYFVFLIYQSYKASFALIWLMLRRKYQPGVIRVRTRLRSRVGRTMLANTISLVPGTLSLWVEGNFIYVHWFDRKSEHRVEAARMITQPMERLLAKIFG